MDKTNADCVENSESHVVKIIHVSRGKKPKGTRNLGTPFKVEVSFLFIISQSTPPSFLKEGLVSRDFFFRLMNFCYIDWKPPELTSHLIPKEQQREF